MAYLASLERYPINAVFDNNFAVSLDCGHLRRDSTVVQVPLTESRAPARLEGSDERICAIPKATTAI
jgi:hypothetical protein